MDEVIALLLELVVGLDLIRTRIASRQGKVALADAAAKAADVQLLASAEEDGALRPQLWTRTVGAGRVTKILK